MRLRNGQISSNSAKNLMLFGLVGETGRTGHQMVIRFIIACFIGAGVGGCEQKSHEASASTQKNIAASGPSDPVPLESHADNRQRVQALCTITENMIGKVAVGQTLAALKKSAPEANFESFVDGDGVNLLAIKFSDHEVVTPSIPSESIIKEIWIDDDERNICQTAEGLRVGVEFIHGKYGNVKISTVTRRSSDVIQILGIDGMPSTIKLASFSAADFEGESIVSTATLTKVRVDRIYVSSK